jgi:protein-S-isoprenylcysteine O-methyltransferase Ste14
LFVDALLILQFGLQHSVMARPGFKELVTRLVPQPAERSLYVLASNVSLALFFWQWRPLGGVVWDVQSPVGQAASWMMFGVGWLMVLITTFLINHFDLFGLRQVWLYFRGRPCLPLPFVTPGPYKYIRHPLYVGWTIAFWATPTMTFAHLVFAAGMTAYMLIAIWFEERDLVRGHAAYAAYRAAVPMLIPNVCKPRTATSRPEPVNAAVPATVSDC